MKQKTEGDDNYDKEDSEEENEEDKNTNKYS
jgi:hypothetical protein